MKIWLDGKLVDESEAKVSVFDHGLLYGDGVFEGIRFYNGRIFRLEEHIRRLFDSSRAIILDLPWTQEEVCKFTCETVAANGLTDGYIRLVVTRGPNTGSEWDLEHVITTAGRHPDSDIFLDDVTVSRRHAEIERTPTGTVVVRDVGSLNGTYLNQQRIDGDVPMANGDELQVGKFKLVYLAGQGS